MNKQRMYDNEEYVKYSKKALSTRLQPYNLAYFLKYAQENDCENITDTFNKLIGRLAQLESLDDVTFKGTKFEDVQHRVQREFLVENPYKKKETISLTKKKLPPIEVVDESEEETESDVLEI